MGTPSKHALLGPSGASRWLTCTPSARLEEPMPDTTSTAAEEGTLAHEIAELYAKLLSGKIVKSTFNKKLRVLKKHPLFQNEMLEHCEAYANFVIESFNEAKQVSSDAILELESQADLTEYVPESFGTVDNNIVADETLYITDFKYGKGLKVSAEENKQMMLYALGVLGRYDLLYDIENVVMTIHQPRLDNVSSFEMSVEDLKAWGEEIKPKAQMAFNGEGEQVSGEHCIFCKVKNTCRKRAEENMELAKKEFAKPPVLDDDEIAEILPQLNALAKWAKDIQAYAFTKALAGHKWDGYKLVAGKSNRCVADVETMVAELKAQKLTEDQMYNKKLIGIGAMEKLVGKKTMSDFEIRKLIIKPPGAPALVPDTDKRPEMQTKTTAADDFADDNEELLS